MGKSGGTPVWVHLAPGLFKPSALGGGVAVVMDVLRATTVMIHALAAGARAVAPCGEIDEARACAGSLPAGSAILAGERGGLPIEGFDLGNSPREFTAERCRGKTLVMTTTNGTRAILASLEAEPVFIAAFVNLAATVNAIESALALRPAETPLHLVCAGTDGAISLEDALLAGAVAGRLAERQGTQDIICANDAAILASSLWRDAAGKPLAALLRTGRGGRNVVSIGREIDIDDSAQIDRIDLAAVLRREPVRIEAQVRD